MPERNSALLLSCLAVTLVAGSANAAAADFDLGGYSADPDLQVAVAGEDLTVTWRGAGDNMLRMSLSEDGAVPAIRELAIRQAGGPWITIAEDAAFEFAVTEGYRRITEQQLEPLRELGVELTPEVIDRHKWDAFWDSPLLLGEAGIDESRGVPPVAGVANQPGLPRQADEISHGRLALETGTVAVTNSEGSLRIAFPNAKVGSFAGAFVITVFAGTNLIQSEFEGATARTSVAYKYDAGISGLPTRDGTAVSWNDTANNLQNKRLGSAPANDARVLVPAANRIIAADTGDGAIAAFPPPHVWYWAREVSVNLGNNYYRKDGDRTVAIGVGQAEAEGIEEFAANWSLYSAPPGSVQRMRAYFYVTPGNADSAIAAAQSFTNGDVYRDVPGYKVMSAHYHKYLDRQWRARGTDYYMKDFDALKDAGVDILSPAAYTTAATMADGDVQLEEMLAMSEGIAKHSDEDFIILPTRENTFSLGGHWDLWMAHPVVYRWLGKPRTGDQPLVRNDPEFGRMYQLGSSDDIMAMVDAENMLVFMPHPRTKGSTGYPEEIRDTPAFRNNRYRGVGWRWGMGADLSEIRMSEKRVLPLLDEMNNWAIQDGYDLKYIQAINETYWQQPGDDIYGMAPVQYIKLDRLPQNQDFSPIIAALRNGDFFVTTGEVLIQDYGVQGSGKNAVYKATLSWTFPLDFLEVVWGDGQNTHVETFPATGHGAFGQHSFELPVDLSTAAWVRFAAWDVAGNGLLTNPVRP